MQRPTFPDDFEDFTQDDPATEKERKLLLHTSLAKLNHHSQYVITQGSSIVFANRLWEEGDDLCAEVYSSDLHYGCTIHDYPFPATAANRPSNPQENILVKSVGYIQEDTAQHDYSGGLVIGPKIVNRWLKKIVEQLTEQIQDGDPEAYISVASGNSIALGLTSLQPNGKLRVHFYLLSNYINYYDIPIEYQEL